MEKENFKKEINKLKDKKNYQVKVVFKLYDTYGFPPEVTKELAKESGYEIDMKEFEELFKAHQEKSRAGSEQKFKGGLAEQNEITIAYHTATHLFKCSIKTGYRRKCTSKRIKYNSR